MIERIHLTILREINRQGTLTGAAERLCLTQPALTHAVKKLEKRLGTALWTREGRRLILTRAGHYLLDLAECILPQLEHAEEMIRQIAQGRRGLLRIGMECHPCYHWLLSIVSSFLETWPDVDVDVKQDFRFGGIKALSGYDIDLLITPDPLMEENLLFSPVFDYQLVLAVSPSHDLAGKDHVTPMDLSRETLITYPVPKDRLDVFTQFLTPAHVAPKKHKTIETMDIMLQMVAANRGVTALPRWLVEEYKGTLHLKSLRLGSGGIWKQIFVGIRKADRGIDYIKGFIRLAES